MEKLTADQALRLYKANEPKIESLLQFIKTQAENGLRYIVQMNVSDEMIVELIGLGYQVSKHTDQIGNEWVKIKW